MRRPAGEDEVTRVIRTFGVRRPAGADQPLDFRDLMQVRFTNILLVASLYDHFTIAEDEHLTEAIFNAYFELNLHSAPAITRASSGEAALRLVESGDYDLVISMLRLGDMDIASFCDGVRRVQPDLPVVLLSFAGAEADIVLREAGSAAAVENVFEWSGDRALFIAIVKLLEDRRNARADCLGAGVRAILLVEDSPAFYSSYLPLIYTEIIKQVHGLIEEGKNFADKVLRQRARPKILLARDYEEAEQLFETYRECLLGVISDMRFRCAGGMCETAGLDFARHVRRAMPEMPVLIQTSEPGLRRVVEAEGLQFADKNSRTLLQEVRDFMTGNFGFGDFVFRAPDGTEVARARTLREMREKLKYVPASSLQHHASRDHFSNWLMARTRFELARQLKPVKVSEFQDMEQLRTYLVDAITRHLIEDQKGVISDFSRSEYDPDDTFLRIGSGSLGGKGRGLAFMDNLLRRYFSPAFFPGVKVSIPRTIALGTDVFAQFIEQNDLLRLAVSNASDAEILRAFLHADLPPTVIGDLRAILEKARFPLAVRSSSLLEDAMYQPFAGIYATVMIPNSNPDPTVRFHSLVQAVKYVYASTYFRAAKNYIEATANRIEEERMAVLVQEMVGEKHGRYFYPHISGVARSYNYYPFGKATPKDGVVNLALGLGKTIVDGGTSLQYSPAYPGVYPQLATTRDLFHNSQLHWYALDLQSDVLRKSPSEDQHLAHLDLRDAEEQGALAWIASTYSGQDDRLYEGVSRSGPRVITFAPILKSGLVPLNDLLRLLVTMCETAVNCPVEIEFAMRLGRETALPAEFSFLQLRPMVKQEGGTAIDEARIPRDAVLFRCEHALGNGAQRMRDIVYVKHEAFDLMKTRVMAKEIAGLNRALLEAHRPYLLIGPGRWGSSDPYLGIPVGFGDISAARVIAETTLPDLMPDPSQGSHFFQNLTSFRISYFTLRHYNEEHSVDWDWLSTLETVHETPHCRHVRAPEDLVVLVDGTSGAGVALKRDLPPA